MNRQWDLLTVDMIDKYLGKPYWVIDILPKKVPLNSPGQYFKIEKYFLVQPQFATICRKFTNVLVKLNCYDDIKVCHNLEEWLINPSPEMLEEWMHEGKMLYFVLKESNAMIGFNGDDHYMTIYNPDEVLLELIQLLATSEGLFVWKPET